MSEIIYIAVFILFQISFLLQLYYVFVVHRKLSVFRSPNTEDAPCHPVSVIVCARNEELKLERNLPAILEQDYENFEVVVVNDCSIDETDLMLRELSGRYFNLKVVTINEHKRFKHGKKFAVTLGIKAASHEHMLFTDADCVPASNQWLRLMQRNFTDSTEIVLGYSPYEKLAGFVNKLIRFETFFTALNYLSYALAGDPYMGVGRNMAYKKSLFFRGKGFASHMHIPSGDDDLFVNQNASAKNTVIEIHPETHVWSEPKKTLSTYIDQKVRHLGAGKAYKSRHKRMLSIQVASAICFYICLFALIALKAQWWLLLAVFVIRFLSQLFVYRGALKKLNYSDLVWWLPVFDFIYYFYILALSIVTLFKKRVQWK